MSQLLDYAYGEELKTVLSTRDIGNVLSSNFKTSADREIRKLFETADYFQYDALKRDCEI